MEEKMIKECLEQLENGHHGFLRTLSPTQQWELGTMASHWEEPLHFGDFDWNSERADLTNLNRLFGAKITDYGWSVYDTYDHVISENIPVIAGIMAGLGFNWVALQEGAWYEADQELTSSMSIEEKKKALSGTFWMKVRFYPNRPGEDKRPDAIWSNDGETIGQVLEAAQDMADIVDARNKLWWASYWGTPLSKKYNVLSRLESLEPRITGDGKNAVFRGLKSENELVFFGESVLLVQYKRDVVAFGPDAILMA